MTNPCPPDHKHGAAMSCYHNHGCRCDDCRNGARVRAAKRRREQAYGRYKETRIAAIGARRRIQGLRVAGWTVAHIAEATGFDALRLHSILTRNNRLSVDTHNVIVNATRTLIGRGPGPSKRAADHARRQGWVSLLAWDDDIDDPAATPADVTADKTLVDEVRVWHAVDGPPRRHRLTATERREAIRILWARKWTDRKIGTQLGCDERTVYRIRNELGLPAFEYAELIKQEAA